MPRILLITLPLLAGGTAFPGAAQEGLPPGETNFHTFSIAAVDPDTGESGVAVTTRNPCVANGVSWVRVGVGAVATQARTRTQYGEELLSRLESGMSAEEALRDRLAQDESAEFRQVGVVGLSGRVAQHTGAEDPLLGRAPVRARITPRRETCSSAPRWWTPSPRTSNGRGAAASRWRTA